MGTYDLDCKLPFFRRLRIKTIQVLSHTDVPSNFYLHLGPGNDADIREILDLRRIVPITLPRQRHGSFDRFQLVLEFHARFLYSLHCWRH